MQRGLRTSARRRKLLLAGAATLLSGCAPTGFLYKGLQGQSAPAAKNVLVMKPDVRLFEIGMGGQSSRMADSEQRIAQNMAAVAARVGKSERLFEAYPVPELNAGQEAALVQHQALFNTMAVTLLEMKRRQDSAWSHKRESFDYTLGPGMAFLADAAAADAIIFMLIEDHIRSTGKKGLDLATWIMSLGMKRPGAVPGVFTVGLVELQSGNVLWFNNELSGLSALNEETSVETVMAKVFAGFPRRKG